MTRLSVNINKIATLRNARGGNVPNLVKVAYDCESFGAEGISLHPRPDGRHVRYQDVLDLYPRLRTEFNVAGYPSEEFIELVLRVKPTQVTLVPDEPEALTSNAGWDTVRDQSFLEDIILRLKASGIRISIFVDADMKMVKYAAKAGADRVELRTKPYADEYSKNRDIAIEPFVKAAECAKELGLGVNAGNNLNLENLHFFYKSIPYLKEVSVGHALVSDALYLGLENTIKAYKECLKENPKNICK